MPITFLSHSSSDKPFVKPIADLMGGSAIYDNYSFEACKQSLQEIVDSMQGTDLFVLFISDESLNSNWVKREINEANLRLIGNGLNKIMPILIDPEIDYDDARIPPLIRSYNLKFVGNSRIAYHKIQKRIRELSLEKYPKLLRKEELFVGRNKLIEEFEEKIFKDISSIPETAIISGIEGIGRRKLVKVGLKKTGIVTESNAIPFSIFLESKNSIEDFILQLADLGYSKIEDLFSSLDTTIQGKIDLARNIIQEYFDHNEQIMIIDDGCIVQPTTQIVNWFEKVIKGGVQNRVKFVIISSFRPSIKALRNKNIIHINVPPLSFKDIKTLFNRWAKIEELELNQSDADFFIEKLNGLPGQVFFAVDFIKENGLFQALKRKNEILEYGDRNVSRVVSKIESEKEKFELLVLLSKFDFISYDMLHAIVQNKKLLDETLEEFYINSIFSEIGPDLSYIKMNSAFRDYITRSSIALNQTYSEKLKTEIGLFLDGDSDIDEMDYSRIAVSVKGLLAEGKKVPMKYLIPSFVLKTIVDLYYKRKFDRVINLSDQLLEGKHKLDIGVIYELFYWRCQAFAWQKHSDKFFEEVENISGADYDFLKGFYFRRMGKYERAESSLIKSLSTSPGFNRAKRELVIVYMNQGRYLDAVELAGENYRNKPTNAYHIQAYFTCSIRNYIQNNSDKEILIELLKAIERSHGVKARGMEKIMKAEYEIFVENNIDTAIKILEEELEHGTEVTNKPYAYRSLIDIYKRRHFNAQKRKLEKKYNFGTKLWDSEE